ncbi:type II toxin-antitoxin system VapC family toxin [Bathymodiolus platifrons methanotrophic gill symbiont]|uniref:type II toxin-antitoxin system VapC family toxin n=1 Tax=Bathymodiolus platifrons methanotrophic gill symbiont TaxID=113268 RepID=UPI001E5EBD62|nr:type II toxin-antitoxin system VapC family toxin [Bathymodiolus platifrons methanotrophic gill symbiont]
MHQHCVFQLLNNWETSALEVLATFNQHAGHMCISSITLAELLHGVEKSAQPAHNLRQVENFVSRLDVVEYGSKAAEHYGNIRAVLEKHGQTIGVNDIHIAGHARSEGLILVTNNLKEFERVEALRLDNWV